MEAGQTEDDMREIKLSFVAVRTACVALVQRRSRLQKQIEILTKTEEAYENQIAALRHQLQLTEDALLPYRDALRPRKD